MSLKDIAWKELDKANPYNYEPDEAVIEAEEQRILHIKTLEFAEYVADRFKTFDIDKEDMNLLVDEITCEWDDIK